MYDYLIVGAGFAGCTVAERLASQSNAKVLVVDERDHVGGNAHDFIDESGNRVHRYGPHVFHTSSVRVVEYLSRFTAWRPYEHRVLANLGGRYVPVPVNRTTLNRIYGLSLTEDAAARFLRERAEPRSKLLTSEDAVVSKTGRDLYELLYRGYTRKHWGLDPRELDASVCGRIPVRTNDDDRYFSDWFQAMPAGGFTALCKRMLDHPNIETALSMSFESAVDAFTFDRIVYTGPIDAYYDHRFGRLAYRSLHFEFLTVPSNEGLPAGCVNEPSEHVAYTRTTDFAHVCANSSSTTVLCREYPRAVGEPYYPIPRPENRELYRRYKKLADRERNVTFVGRLAEYRYYNMDQVVASALAASERLARDGAARQIA